MKSNYLKSPLGAFFFYTLLLGLYGTCGFAQTRLDSTQVTPLSGDALGPFATTHLRDFNSAVDHGNGVSNAVASAIVDCSGVTFSCSIIVPPSYTTAEGVPGYRLNYAVTPSSNLLGNLLIFDHRYGDARISVNALGFQSGIDASLVGWLFNYYKTSAQNAKLYSILLNQLSLDGGTSEQSAALNFTNKTTWETISSNEISHTPGQHLNLAMGGQTTSVGDFTPIKNQVTCFGGYTTEGDQGCRAFDNIVAQGTSEYSGTLTGSPTSGATSVTVSPTQGALTQGTGRFLVKMNAGTISAGTISQVSNNNGKTTITGAGTSWPVSTVIGTLGTNVPYPGSTVVTPSSFSVGSLAGIQTSTMVCVSDQESFEMLYPTAVTATTFTAKFAKIHFSNALISVGGLCGYVMDLTADDVTNASYPVKLQTITGTLHFAWPIMDSTSATSADMWVTADGVRGGVNTRWNGSSPNNGYVLYPFAEVRSAQLGGGISNTLTLSTNQVPWTAGDTVSEFLYPAFHATFGNTLIEGYYPNSGPTNLFSLAYNMPLQGRDAMVSLTNNGSSSFYIAHGGRYYPPAAIHISGRTSKSLTFDQPADKGAVSVNCAGSCNSYIAVVAVSNSIYYDFFSYDEANKHWVLSANNYNGRYSLAGNVFNVPFGDIFITSDSSSKGYLATQELRSNAAANTDVSGELVFSNASSVTQPLQGSYTSHPECSGRPQFDAGSGNRFWTTYSGSSFTINFASAVSGTVTYSCVGRN